MYVSFIIVFFIRRTRSAATGSGGGGGGGLRGGERRRRGRGSFSLWLACGAARTAVRRSFGACARTQTVAAQENAARPVLSAETLRTRLREGALYTELTQL